jgi:hypothetical protein
MRKLLVLIGASLVLLCADHAQAWWFEGHAHITENSVQHLPQPLKKFVNDNLTSIRSYSANEPPGRHYIDIDVYPEFHSHTMPRDLNVLYTKYGTSYVDGNGISPWTIQNYRQTLTGQMQAATTPAQWLALTKNFGEMAHYIEDIFNPLHTTQNFDGQLTGNSGIHGRYEGSMIERHFADLNVPTFNAQYVPDTVDAILNSIDVTWNYVDDIMAADTLARGSPRQYLEPYYTSMWSSTGTFTQDQFKLASRMVANTWYSAWVDAGSPTPIPEPALISLLLVPLAFLSRRR